MTDNTVNTSTEIKDTKKATEELLVSKGISSEAQKESTIFQKFMDSSVAWVIFFEVAIILIFGLLAPAKTFLTVPNIFNVAFNASQIMILAVACTFVITSGCFDMSLGMNLILTSVIGAKVFKAIAGTPQEIAQGLYPHMALGIIMMIIVALLVGIAAGALNGFFVATLKLPAFIGTLASMYIFQGTELVISNGALEKGIPRSFETYFGHAKLFDLIPLPLLAAVIIGLVFMFIMKETKFGVHIRAVGSNEEAARRAGIKVTWIRYKTFMVVGALAACAGMIDVFRFATTNPSGHVTDSMMAIMASVMGGTSLSGGRPSVGGAMLASLIPVTLQIGMVVLRINTFYQYIAMGIFVVIAVWLDERRIANRQ